MEPHLNRMTSAHAPVTAVLDTLTALADWIAVNSWWLVLLAVAVWTGWECLLRWAARRALARRTHLELVPAAGFEPDSEQIWRQGMQLVRAAGSGPWWTPRRARSVRVRLRADGVSALVYRIEAPASAHVLLAQTPFGPRVAVREVPPVPVTDRPHVVRAVLTLHGEPGSRLREVPLDPDPLQPLLDAVSDVRADLGDVAEVCVDLSPASRWHLAVRRMTAMRRDREKARREAQRDARWLTRASEDSFTSAMGRLLDPQGSRGRMVMSPQPRRTGREKVLGKLVHTPGLVRVQILIRCASQDADRAQQRLARVGAAMDVYAGPSRMTSIGWSLGPVRVGPDRRPWRGRFDEQWERALIQPARGGWAHIDELAGFLKPVTAAARVPLMESEVPTYQHGADLLPQGWYRGPDGRERLLATPEDDTLFEVQSGKAGWGKTTKAQVQAVASAHNRRGLAFVDPHGDSFADVAPYLAHEDLIDRVALFDLTVHTATDRLGCWNLLDMSQDHRVPHEVCAAVVEAFAGALGWGDVTSPRALTILTKAVEALVAVNVRAVAAQQPKAQATVFQIRALLTGPQFRKAVVAVLDEEAQGWWTEQFPDLPREGLMTVLNPLERLAASPVVRAFLGCPVSGYDIRRAMDDGQILWICPPGTGPTDRLLISLIVHDFLRAGLSRRNLHETQRRPFRFYLDEMISLDQGTVLAEITEQLRKFGCRLHGMTQLLHRLNPATRAALMQNASCLSTTAGSVEAIAQITAQWPGTTVTPADIAALPRWQHYASFTIDGSRIGPLPLRGPTLEEVFGHLARPREVKALYKAAHRATGALSLAQRTKTAAAQQGKVLDFLTASRSAAGARTGEQYA
ncbi:type IV secretory system conjugative DNA transfer family protein [Streptomyces sp. NBC_00536]|uniref:ATP/GTP-binding protein n=1 Tax=Streptomyces sp. NBC_00536 TaxID=2975769 RepID=UPI002E817016|nr:ATP/GTP-binding protein [Streptomyces sp. NBC_00536]WUC83451.1 type IV secretory system conjugative DNA transfer family protein [Streptomyces sp. NBC_00536]